MVAFSTRANAMHREMLPANAANIERTLRYLDKFTPERIRPNVGTNILAALESALTLDPSVIVLITDGLPTTVSGGSFIEINTQKILDAVREQNRNNAAIYVVALEIDIKRSPGAQLLVSLAEEHNGKIKVIGTPQLAELTEPNGTVE